MKLSGMADDGNNNVTEQQRHRDILVMLLQRVVKDDSYIAAENSRALCSGEVAQF